MKKTILLVMLMCLPLYGSDNKEIRITYRQLFDAIREVETGGHPNGGRDAVGDSNTSNGPFQIQRAYWIDATQHDKTIGGTYADVKNKAYAEKIMMSYWHRYGSKAPSAEELSRIHNGGPAGYKRNSTLGYWNKTRAIILRNIHDANTR